MLQRKMLIFVASDEDPEQLQTIAFRRAGFRINVNERRNFRQRGSIIFLIV